MGKNRKERLGKTWNKEIADILKNRGRTWQEAQQLT